VKRRGLLYPDFWVLMLLHVIARSDSDVAIANRQRSFYSRGLPRYARNDA